MRINEWMDANPQFSQADLAELLGVSQPTISKAYHGQTNLEKDTAARLVKLSGGKVSLEEALWNKEVRTTGTMGQMEVGR